MDVLTKTVARALRIGNSIELWRLLLPQRHSSLNWKSIFNSVTNCSFAIRFISKILDFKASPCQTSLLSPNFLNLNPNLLFLKSLPSFPYPRASSSLKISSSKIWLLALWCSTKTGSCSCNVAQVNAPFRTFG